MSDKFGSLTDEDIRQIAQLIETLDRSSFDYLRLDTGTLKVVVGKGAAPPEQSASISAEESTSPAAPDTARPKPAAASPHGDDVVAVSAPMIGTFYAQPEPGAAPFVTVGAKVTAESTVGLIEVMKVYTSVEAGVAGEICEICVQNGAFVEFGAVLLRIRKSASTTGKNAAPAKTQAEG